MLRISTPCRACPDWRPHRKTPSQSSEGPRRISRHVPGRPARRHRAPRLRRQDSFPSVIAQAHSGVEKVLQPRSRSQRQPQAHRNQKALEEQFFLGEEKMTQDRLRMLLEARMTGDGLIQQFEDGTTPRGTFHHADHVRLAFEYLDRYPALEALEKFSAALKRFAAAQGKPQLYHETITWSYLLRMRERMARAGRSQTWEEFAERNPDLLIWKGGVLATLYRQETLDSDLARHTFVLPDQGL